MIQKASRGTPLATVAPRNVISSAARDTWDYSERTLREQHEIDTVGLLARRSGVDPVTVKHQISVWSIGENRS